MTNKRIARVKICCISSHSEAHTAIKYGASAIGLVSKMPSGQGVISDKKISHIAKAIPPGVASFLLTCQTNASEIISQHRKFRTNTLQLVDKVSFTVYRSLREQLPGISIVQVIHVVNTDSIEYSIKVSAHVDALLLDSGNPDLEIKELGGTGRVHDWKLSKKICQSVDIPVYLAGGLNAENVRRAIDFVEPFGVDLCSGVRTSGVLDEKKLELFFKHAGY